MCASLIAASSVAATTKIMLMPVMILIGNPFDFLISNLLVVAVVISKIELGKLEIELYISY